MGSRVGLRLNNLIMNILRTCRQIITVSQLFRLMWQLSHGRLAVELRPDRVRVRV